MNILTLLYGLLPEGNGPQVMYRMHPSKVRHDFLSPYLTVSSLAAQAPEDVKAILDMVDKEVALCLCESDPKDRGSAVYRFESASLVAAQYTNAETGDLTSAGKATLLRGWSGLTLVFFKAYPCLS